jgi:hypothetical protein
MIDRGLAVVNAQGYGRGDNRDKANDRELESESVPRFFGHRLFQAPLPVDLKRIVSAKPLDLPLPGSVSRCFLMCAGRAELIRWAIGFSQSN